MKSMGKFNMTRFSNLLQTRFVFVSPCWVRHPGPGPKVAAKARPGPGLPPKGQAGKEHESNVKIM